MGKLSLREFVACPVTQGGEVVEVKFELGDVRVQALLSDRVSLSFNVSGGVRDVGATLSPSR